MITTYLTIVAMLLLVTFPVLVPLAISTVHGIRTFANRPTAADSLRTFVAAALPAISAAH